MFGLNLAELHLRNLWNEIQVLGDVNFVLGLASLGEARLHLFKFLDFVLHQLLLDDFASLLHAEFV